MINSNILDEVINNLHPENLSAEYILMAKVTDFHGKEKVYRGKELEKFLNDPDKSSGVIEARVILDVGKIRSLIISEVSSFFEELDLKVSKLSSNLDE